MNAIQKKLRLTRLSENCLLQCLDEECPIVKKEICYNTIEKINNNHRTIAEKHESLERQQHCNQELEQGYCHCFKGTPL